MIITITQIQSVQIVTSFSFEALFSLNKFCLSKMMKAILISNQHIGEKISGFIILNDTKLLQKMGTT